MEIIGNLIRIVTMTVKHIQHLPFDFSLSFLILIIYIKKILTKKKRSFYTGFGGDLQCHDKV